MYKFIAGIISIAILAPMVLFSGQIVSAQDSWEYPATENVAAAGDVVVQSMGESSTDMVFSYQDQPRFIVPGLLAFAEDVYSGKSETITGIFVNDAFAMSVVQQPASQPGFVAATEETITEFGMARDYGSIGMLAHNYLAGEKFFELSAGEPIYLVYGDRGIVKYTILEIDSYQALSPNSPYSSFVNLENPNEQLSAADLFYRIYDQDDVLILQTCIEKEGNESWGRLFIVAVPGDLPTDVTIES